MYAVDNTFDAYARSVPQPHHRPRQRPEALDEMELYDYLSKAPHVNNFIERITNQLNQLGITHFSHTNLRAVADALNPFGNAPPEIMDRYFYEGFHHDDLTLRHVMSSDKPIFQSTIVRYIDAAPFECQLLKRNQDIAKFLQNHKIYDYFCMPFSTGEHRALFSISAKGCASEQFQASVNENYDALLLLAKTVDRIGRRKFASHFHGVKAKPHLLINSKPLLLLQTLATKDLTLNEASQVLDINISTANHQIASAKRALGAQTLWGAIVTALQQGLFSLDL